MAGADAATAVAASSPAAAPTPADHSLSNVSSPLTEVEDKDGEPDDMDLDGPLQGASSLSNANADDDDEGSRAAPSHTVTDAEDESALSEIDPDINDSEAETERLYDTPEKAKTIKDSGARDSSPETSPSKYLSPQKRDRTFQASPSKLKQQIRPDVDGDSENAVAEGEDEDNEADGEEEAVADKNSRRRKSGTKDQLSNNKKSLRNQSPLSAHNTKDVVDKEETPIPPPTRGQRVNSDTRKRKRSPTTDPSESDQPLRKRVGSSGADKVAPEANGDAKLAKPQSNGNGEAHTDAANDETGDQAETASAEAGTNSDTQRIRRSKRGNANNKNRKGSEDADGDEETNEEQHHDEAPEDAEAATADEDGTGAAGEEEHPDGEVDEEAELAHKNEEESTDTDDASLRRPRAAHHSDIWNDANHHRLVAVERKKAAFDQMQAIEKHFAAFRDKLYQERLDQLNQEEAMLMGDDPTHPEYLAMMQCVNERRDEKVRLVDVEYEFNMATLRRWAVGRRTQIHGQYFQAIRESRELVLEELGRQWYQIQQQRRKHANTIPDYGLRFPASKTQRIKDAITYNKEVSILSGIAKYEGFPAAPQIKGATTGQVDDDLDAILRARQTAPQPHPQPQAQIQAPPPSQVHPEQLASGGASGGAVSFNSLGAAGQQFLADTPWANPYHPSHHVQQQQQEQQADHPRMVASATAMPPASPSHGPQQQLPPPQPQQHHHHQQSPLQPQYPQSQAAPTTSSTALKQQLQQRQVAGSGEPHAPSISAQAQMQAQLQRNHSHSHSHHHHHHHPSHHHHHYLNGNGGSNPALSEGKAVNSDSMVAAPTKSASATPANRATLTY